MKTHWLRAAAIAVSAGTSPSFAWDADGHRMICRAAIETAAKQIGPDAPAWLIGPDSRAMISDQAVTPDRWRSTRVAQLTHLNSPDHYLDIEDLADFGLSLQTIPPLRHEYVRQLSLAREAPGFKGKPMGGRLDPEMVQGYPGFLPHAAMETWAKAVSALKTARVIESLADPGRDSQLEMARAGARYNLGILAHYIGDASQPLHTTMHHHGWIGPNPNGYTTDRGIHSYIDGGVIRLHRITIDDVRPVIKPRTPDPVSPWNDVTAEIDRSFAQVKPLYTLKKTGDLDREPGRQFIIERLADGAATLASLYTAAWDASAVGPRDAEDFIKYDGSAENR
jgi:hypothetical protein